MSFVPKPETEGLELPPGFAPRRAIPDAEFEQLEVTYEAQFSEDQRGAIRRLYDHVEDDATAAKPKKTRAATTAGGDA